MVIKVNQKLSYAHKLRLVSCCFGLIIRFQLLSPLDESSLELNSKLCEGGRLDSYRIKLLLHFHI